MDKLAGVSSEMLPDTAQATPLGPQVITSNVQDLQQAQTQYQAGRLDEASQVLTAGRQHGLVGAAVDQLELVLLSRHEKAAVVSLFHAGRLGEAELAAKKLTQRFPNDGFAWKVLGTVLAQQGRSELAWPALQKAIDRFPHDSETHNCMGVVLKDLGRLEEAVASYQRAVENKPDYAQAHFNLGVVLRGLDRADEAVASYQRAVESKPDYAQAHYNLGVVLRDLGRLEAAVASYQRAVAIQPGLANAHNNLGNIFTDVGRFDEAVASYRRAVEIQPDYAEAHYNLGNALRGLNRLDEAVTSYQRAVTIQPTFAEAHNNLGNSQRDQGHLDEAVRSFQRALEIQPAYADARSNLSNALKDLGRLDEALAGYRRALEIKPNDLVFRSNLLFLYAFSRVGSFQQEYEEARQWEQVALSAVERQAACDRSFEIPSRQGRPLRLGIVSAELSQHAVAYFLTSFLGAIDRKRLTVLLYPTTLRPDPETESLRALADGWSPLYGRPDAAAAAHIRADGVDILLDTTGHTQGCRLGIFAHRAAPVQCHYIGYAGTTGLTEMDYFLADSVLIPEDLDRYFQEFIWRLPRPWVAYAPLEEAPDPAWRPARDGRIRLGSFNNLTKLSDSCLSLWSQVLQALPEATLLLKDKMALDRTVQKRIVDAFTRQGIEKGRVAFLPKVSDWRRHMALYDQLDIALDTIPFGSGTTGFDALWMGVPLITFAGNWMGGRMGASMLTGMGHPEWIARTDAEYVAKIVSLGRNVELRTRLRSTQRQRMRESSLCDGRNLARTLETAFECMSDKWWARKKTSTRPPVEVPSLPERKNIVDPFNARRPADAVTRYQRAIEIQPDFAEAHFNLGNALKDLGRWEEAVVSYQRAVAIQPDHAEAHYKLGNILSILGRLDEAVANYRQAVAIHPNFAEAHYNLGNSFKNLGLREEAVASYRQAVAIQPDFAKAHNNLGNSLQDLSRLEEAATCYQQAVAIQPDYVDAHSNLGSVLKNLGRLAEAEASCRRALAIQPDHAEAHNNLGNVLRDLGRLNEAVTSYHQALAIKPNHANSLHNLGNALQELGRVDEALTNYQRAVEIQPDSAETHCSLSITLQDLGRPDEALASCRRAVEIQPSDLAYRSNLLFLYAFGRVGSFQQEYEEARKWEQVALSEVERQAAHDRVWEIPARPGRPLRVGIASAELGQHAVSYFLTSFLGALDRKRLTVLLYPTTLRGDPETESLRALADGWSPLFGRSDAEAAAHIRAAGVDILLDTTGHTQHCRLGIFAHRAAPVQCHYIGYAGTTGLTEMDYFLADPVLIPKELDQHFQETIWRLPRPWVAYVPVEGAPDPAWRPAKDGRVRLGSFNNLRKLSDSCLSLWARVLRALPEATLLLKDKKALDRAVQGRIMDTLTRQGVEPDRVAFLPKVPDWRQHMSQYNQLDIALDTSPFGSGTTGFDALWMGVPLITLAGNWLGGRMGASMLTGMGHPEWIARTDDEYVAKVVSLARDWELRTRLRATQRERMRESPLCDGHDLARALETAFEAMFDQWWARRN